MLTDATDGRRRVVHGLIFTAVYSRHMFVWPTYRQTLADVIAGFEAAWEFFGGVFSVVIPDNMKAIVDRRRCGRAPAERLLPRVCAVAGLRDRPGAGPQPER